MELWFREIDKKTDFPMFYLIFILNSLRKGLVRPARKQIDLEEIEN